MSTPIFTEIPMIGYTYTDILPVSIRKFGGPFEEVRTLLADISRRRYQWMLGRDNTERQTVDAFLVKARSLQYEAFYVKDPLDSGLTDVSIGTGTGAAVTFSFPTSGENRRYYPVSTGLVVKVNGVPATVASVNTDARTVTMASPPAGSATVVASCDVYRYCRLESISWNQADPNFWNCSITIEELISENG